MTSIKRLGFSPYAENIDNALEGGIPQGSWVTLYGPPGSYKSLHALAFLLAGLEKKDKAILVSTEMQYDAIIQQMKTLGWTLPPDIIVEHFTNKIPETRAFGDYDLIIIDRDSLRFWGYKLGRFVREAAKESKKKVKKVWFEYNDPDLLTHIIITALAGVGAIRKNKEISLNEIFWLRLRDSLYSKKADIDLNTNVSVRIVIDSISLFWVHAPSTAGKILTDMRIRLEAPNITYILTSNVPKSAESEYGALVGHVADGRIWLYYDIKGSEMKYYGLITKMRMTNHSRRVHEITINEKDRFKVLKWNPA